MDEFEAWFKRRYAEAIDRRDISITDLARTTGLSRQMLYRYRKPDSPLPPVDAMIHIAEAMGESFATWAKDWGDRPRIPPRVVDAVTVLADYLGYELVPRKTRKKK